MTPSPTADQGPREVPDRHARSRPGADRGDAALRRGGHLRHGQGIHLAADRAVHLRQQDHGAALRGEREPSGTACSGSTCRRPSGPGSSRRSASSPRTPTPPRAHPSTGVPSSSAAALQEDPRSPRRVPKLPALQATQTTRQQVEMHTAPDACQACHVNLINPVGFGFESYDAVGQYRTTENGVAIDASGTLAGTQLAAAGQAGFTDAISRVAADRELDRRAELLRHELGPLRLRPRRKGGRWLRGRGDRHQADRRRLQRHRPHGRHDPHQGVHVSHAGRAE